MLSKDFVSKVKAIALNKSTVYMWGSFGQKLTDDFIANKAKQYPKEYTSKLVSSLKARVEKGAYAFDCSGLIKGVLWGWDDGGAEYQSNDVSDINANTMIEQCSDVSDDFSKITIGEIVWIKGHVGVYIGNQQVVESTTAWDPSGVGRTLISTIGAFKRPRVRKWDKHGKLNYIEYSVAKSACIPEGRESRIFY